MKRSSTPVVQLAQRIILLAVLISSFGFFEIDNSDASEIKKKSINAVAVKTAGRTNTTANVNTLLNGIGAPSSSLGINGDLYIDTVSMNIYGPKTKGAWPLPKSLIGPQGTPGPTGKAGNSGKDGVNGKDGERGPVGATSGGSGSVGPQGPIGLTGPTGSVGLQGTQGLPGVTGATGATGPAGATGAAGVAGATGAQGIQGETGPRGLQGLQGDVGATGAPGLTGATGPAGAQGVPGVAGAVGATGATGAQGIAGPTQVYFANLTFSGQLSGTSGTTKNANDFGTLVPGRKYLLTAYIYSSSDITTLPPLSASVAAVGALVTPTTKFSPTYGFTYRSSLTVEEWGLSINSTIDGSALVGANYQLRIGVTCGINTSGTGSGLKLDGYYLLQEVSAIN